MQKLSSRLLLLLFYLVSSCKSEPEYGNPVIDPAVFAKDDESFAKHYYPILHLDEDFTALDQNSRPMDKTVFLEALQMGTFLPLKQKKGDSTYYRLYKISDKVPGISATIKVLSLYAYKLHLLEGKPLPNFDFTDIKGNRYDSINTRGKTVVLKFWFTGCSPCIAEMPDLNNLMAQYQKDSVVFLSLAFDSKKSLEKFLASRKFDYPVVPQQRSYIVDSLHITSFPTHIVINKQGIITKAVSSYKYLKMTLDKELQRRS